MTAKMLDTNITKTLFDQVSSLSPPKPHISTDQSQENNTPDDIQLGAAVQSYKTPFRRDDIPNPLLREAYGIDTQITKLHYFLLSRREAYLAFAPHQTHQRRYNYTANRRRQPTSSIGLTGKAQSRLDDGPTSPTVATAWMTEEERRQVDTNTTALLQTLASSISLLNHKGKQDATLKAGLAEGRRTRRKNQRFFTVFSGWRNPNSDSTVRVPSQLSRSTENNTYNNNDDDDEVEIVLKTLSTFWDGMVMFLTERLSAVSTLQAGLVRIWAERESEKAKSSWGKVSNRPLQLTGRATAIVAGSANDNGSRIEVGTQRSDKEQQILQPKLNILDRASPNTRTGFDAMDLESELSTSEPAGRNQFEASLSTHMLATLEKENDQMVQQAQNDMEQLRKTQDTIMDISALQSQLMTHLSVQANQIELLSLEIEETTEDVNQGNNQLKKANSRPSTARKVFLATAGLCASLVAWDLIF